MRTASLFAAVAAFAVVATAAPAPTCLSRQYLDSATGTCKVCPTGMNTCSSATVAITCTRGRYMTPTMQCVLPNACPAGTYRDSASTSCKKCYQVNAATCTDGSQTGSTSCISGSCMYNGKCVYNNRMAGGFYCSAAGIQTACSDGASKCDSTGKATTCKTGYTPTTAGACLQCATGETFDPASQTCKSGAAACTASDHFWNTVTSFCEPICQQGTLVNGVYTQAYRYVYGMDKCMPCGQGGAIACDYLSRPTSCFEGYNLGDGWCAKCTSDQVWDAAANNCQCLGATYTTDSSGKITITRAAKAQDPNTAAQSCIACPDSLTAITCKGQGTQLVSTACLPGFTLGADGSCNHCADANQAFDATTGTCSSCAMGELIFGGYSGVKPASRVDPSTGTCVPCSVTGAETCSSDDKALTCLDTYTLYNGGCIKCGTYQTFNTETHQCEAHCPGAGTTYCGTDGYCYVNTPATFPTPVNNQCVVCADSASSCDALGTATACIPGHGLIQGKCPQCLRIDPTTGGCDPTVTCADGLYGTNPDGSAYITHTGLYADLVQQRCVACSDQRAVHCKADGTPGTCIPGWNAYGSLCIQCPAGYTFDATASGGCFLPAV